MAKKILIIEDEPPMIQVLTEYLDTPDYEIKSASNGIEGLLRVRNWGPDVIICDIKMPVLDGLGFLNRLYFEEQKPTPVIMISGYGNDSLIESVWAAGAFDFQAKPIDPKQLSFKVEQALEKGCDYVKDFLSR